MNSTGLNYESEVSDLLLETLQSIYGVDESVVYHYFYLRFLVEYNDRQVTKQNKVKKIIEFLIRECNLPLQEEVIHYKGEIIKTGLSLENSLENIVLNWALQTSFHNVTTSKGVSLSCKEYLNKEWKQIIKHGKNRAKSYKGMTCYQSYVKWNALEFLNKRYLAQPNVPSQIKGMEYHTYHHEFIRTLEEIYLADIHSIEWSTTNSVSITEQNLEEYLIRHLHVIEEGLRYIDRQVTIKDGRIDILAKDKDQNFVILELKVQEDKELLWQCLYYPTAFKEKEYVNVVRMITIAPKYPSHILLPLKKLKDIEIIQFTPYIELGKIKSLEIRRIK